MVVADRRENHNALVVCIGNDLAGDDGVGGEVYRALKRRVPPVAARLRHLGLGGIDLLDELTGERRLVVVDAVQFGAPPGTVHVLDWRQLPEQATRPVSGHGIGLREAIAVGRSLYPERMPLEISLVGIEGRIFDRLGEGLSDAVAPAVAPAVAAVLRLLARS